jgi:hypothetical protein
MDAGRNEVWGVNRWNEIFVRRGADQNALHSAPWEQHQGEMAYVSTAEQGIVWAIDDDHDVWVLRTGSISVEEVINNEPDWTPVHDVKFTYIDVGKGGQLVAVTNSGCSFWKRGINSENALGDDEWFDLTNDQSVPAAYYKFNTITICNTGNMWATLKDGDSALYFRGGRSN